jgi:hypothetical protein
MQANAVLAWGVRFSRIVYWKPGRLDVLARMDPSQLRGLFVLSFCFEGILTLSFNLEGGGEKGKNRDAVSKSHNYAKGIGQIAANPDRTGDLQMNDRVIPLQSDALPTELLRQYIQDSIESHLTNNAP